MAGGEHSSTPALRGRAMGWSSRNEGHGRRLHHGPVVPRRAQARRAGSPRTAGRVEDCAHSARASTPSPSRRPRRRLVLARRLGDGFGRSRGEPAPPGIGGRTVGLRARGSRADNSAGARPPAPPRRAQPASPSTTGVLSSVAGRAWQGDGLQTQAPGRVVVVQRRGGRWASDADAVEGMTERRWRVGTGPSRGLFLIEVDDGQGFRPATAAEVDSALRQRELFGAADYPDRDLGHDARPTGEPARSPAGRTR